MAILGLALAVLGLIIAGMRQVPTWWVCPTSPRSRHSFRPSDAPHAEAILDTARGIVAWCAAQEDAALAAAPVAGRA